MDIIYFQMFPFPPPIIAVGEMYLSTYTYVYCWLQNKLIRIETDYCNIFIYRNSVEFKKNSLQKYLPAIGIE